MRAKFEHEMKYKYVNNVTGTILRLELYTVAFLVIIIHLSPSLLRRIPIGITGRRAIILPRYD